jgi:hypothetical protein
MRTRCCSNGTLAATCIARARCVVDARTHALRDAIATSASRDRTR